MKSLALCLFLCLGAVWGSLRQSGLSPQYLETMQKVYGLKYEMDFSPTLKQLLDHYAKQPRELEDLVKPPDVTCNTAHPGGSPSTIHELRPWDVDLVGAVGDSITAGFGVGAGSLPEVAIQNRGESWCIGGDRSLTDPQHVTTITNILRYWNPNVEGFSIGTGGTNLPAAGLNRAVGGATNRNMEDQAHNMIATLQADSRYDFENDWKLITLFIGGNDLCASCRNPGYYSPEAYRDGIKAALDVWHAELPRALVQVVTMFDVTPLTELSTGPACDALQASFCSCATNPADRPNMRPTQLAYHDLTRDLINSGDYDTRDDFTVVLQPQMRDIVPPVDANGDPYKDFLSHDCFHPSRPAHQLFSMYLWDTMLTPVGEKKYWDSIDPTNSWVACTNAGDNHVIYTNVNSGLYEKQKKEEPKPIRAHRRNHKH